MGGEGIRPLDLLFRILITMPNGFVNSPNSSVKIVLGIFSRIPRLRGEGDPGEIGETSHRVSRVQGPVDGMMRQARPRCKGRREHQIQVEIEQDGSLGISLPRCVAIRLHSGGLVMREGPTPEVKRPRQLRGDPKNFPVFGGQQVRWLS